MKGIQGVTGGMTASHLMVVEGVGVEVKDAGDGGWRCGVKVGGWRCEGGGCR